MNETRRGRGTRQFRFGKGFLANEWYSVYPTKGAVFAAEKVRGVAGLELSVL
jgi:hypothetical protein